jgi:tetratricopeptide (TPR) repeat protein
LCYIALFSNSWLPMLETKSICLMSNLLILVIQAIPLLHEVVRLAPNVSDGYYLLGLIHDSLGDRKKAFNFHMIAAFFSRKDASLWKKLVAWLIEMGDVALVKHRLSKAIIVDPDDVELKFDGELLYFKAREFLKAAELYEQILGLSPENVEAHKMAAKVAFEGFHFLFPLFCTQWAKFYCFASSSTVLLSRYCKSRYCLVRLVGSS